MPRPRLTHLGGPTTLTELDGRRILTDPTFDPPDEVLPVDVVLLSHDHHADNLDDSGRGLLGRAATVITTAPGARRLAGPATSGESPERSWPGGRSRKAAEQPRDGARVA